MFCFMYCIVLYKSHHKHIRPELLSLSIGANLPFHPIILTCGMYIFYPKFSYP